MTFELVGGLVAEGFHAVAAFDERQPLCEQAFKIENEIAREVMKSEDAKEGPRSFMEKRKPNYKGR